MEASLDKCIIQNIDCWHPDPLIREPCLGGQCINEIKGQVAGDKGRRIFAPWGKLLSILDDNKLNRARTIDAFLLALVLIIDYFSYAFLFLTLTYLDFGQNQRTNKISTRV